MADTPDEAPPDEPGEVSAMLIADLEQEMAGKARAPARKDRPSSPRLRVSIAKGAKKVPGAGPGMSVAKAAEEEQEPDNIPYYLYHTIVALPNGVDVTTFFNLDKHGVRTAWEVVLAWLDQGSVPPHTK